VTVTPEPDPNLPVSPLGLPALVDALEEKSRPTPAGNGPDDGADPQQDQTTAVPGTPEPPD
jgi:hypothetical protein